MNMTNKRIERTLTGGNKISGSYSEFGLEILFLSVNMRLVLFFNRVRIHARAPLQIFVSNDRLLLPPSSPRDDLIFDVDFIGHTSRDCHFLSIVF